MATHPIRTLAPPAVTLAAVALALAALAAAPGLQGRRAEAPSFPPPGQWARKAPADLGMDAAKLADAVAFARSRESTREMDFSDQERIFGSLLGSVPTERARTNGLVIW